MLLHMTVPVSVRDLMDDILESLDPFKSYSKLLDFYHDRVQIKGFELPIKNDLYIFGTGKSASFEVQALKKLIESSPTAGRLKGAFAITKNGHTVEDSFKQWEGDHPLVSEKNISNSLEFVEKLKNISENDAIIFLTSGGTSSLLEIPRADLTFKQLQSEHQRLLNSGLNINEMNRQRKLLSQVKGGGLLNFIATDDILQLVTCDIPNEELSDVGSGPLIGAHRWAKTIMTQNASLLLKNLCDDGQRINQGVFDGNLSELIHILENYNYEKGQFYIGGGEATIAVGSANGLGGRNTHFVLALAYQLYKDPEKRDLKICSIGTDGSDGPTDAAGAYIDYNLFKSLDYTEYLENFDSYHYFKKLGTLIRTGPTKTNVMDIRMIWRE